MDNKLCSFYVNNQLFGNVVNIDWATELYPVVDLGSATVVANFGATSYKYPIPSGYRKLDSFDKFLIQDGDNLESILDSNIIICDKLPITDDKMKSHGIDSLSGINSTIINKIQNNKFKIYKVKY